MPIFSIIIPTKERSHIIGRAINSVITQSVQDWELIIVDDGSTSEEVVRLERLLGGYADKRIKLIHYSNTVNAAYARNFGVEHATSDWIVLLDSDDYFSPLKFEKIQNIIESFDESIARNTVFYSQLMDESIGRVKPDKGLEKKQNLTEYLFCQNGMIQTSSLVLSKSLFNSVKFNPTLTKHQDYDLVFRLREKGAEFYFISECLTYWGDDSVSGHLGQRVDPDYSLNFLIERRELFTIQSADSFVFSHIISPLMRKSVFLANKVIFSAYIKRLISRKLVFKSFVLCFLILFKLKK